MSEIEITNESNLRFYAQLMNTDRIAQRSFNNGRFSGTDINPMWRIKKLTELFGPAGFGWYTDDVNYNVLDVNTGEVAVMCTLKLYVKDPLTNEWSKPCHGVGGNQLVMQTKSGARLNDEAYKMAYTDAFGIACKALGMSADIYFQNDRTKYTLATELNVADKSGVTPASKLPDDLSDIIGNLGDDITKADAKKAIDAFATWCAEQTGNPSAFLEIRKELIDEGKLVAKGAYEMSASELKTMFLLIRVKVVSSQAVSGISPFASEAK